VKERLIDDEEQSSVGLTQTFFCWAARKGYVKSSPFDKARPVGRVSRYSFHIPPGIRVRRLARGSGI